MMRVLVCGGREFSARAALWDALYRLDPSVIIEGGARGADMLAAEWAHHTSTRLLTFPALWQDEGRAAGPRRNQRMLDEGRPDLVLACPGGRGTADMVRRARRAGVTIQHLVHVSASPSSDMGKGE